MATAYEHRDYSRLAGETTVQTNNSIMEAARNNQAVSLVKLAFCSFGCGILTFAVSLGLGIASIVIGATKSGDAASCDKPLQLWTYLHGGGAIAGSLFTLASTFLKPKSKASDEEGGDGDGEGQPKTGSMMCVQCGSSLVGFYSSAIFLLGNVWVWQATAELCGSVLYYWCRALLFLTYAMMGLLVLVTLIVCIGALVLMCRSK